MLVHIFLLISVPIYFHRKEQRFFALIFILLAIYDAILIVYPTVFSFFSNFSLEREIGISENELGIAYINEVLYHIIFLIVFFITPFRKYKNDLNSKFGDSNLSRLFVIDLLLLIAIVYGIKDFINPPIDLEQISEHAEIKNHSNIFEALLYWFASPFKIAGLILSSFIVINNKFKLRTQVIAIFYLALIFISALLIGWRGPLLWIPLLLGSSAYLQRRITFLKRVLVFTMPLIFLFSFIRTYVRVNAVYMNEMPFSKRVSFLFNGLSLVISGDLKLEEERQSLFESFAERAQGVRNSVFLYRLHDSGNRSGGLKPIESALYFPVPRMFWKTKRPPGSINETSYGMAIFLVQSERDGADIEMGPITVSGHAYWEGGWLGILLIPIISSFFWKFLLNWVSTRSIIGYLTLMIFMGSLLIDGIYTIRQPLYAIIVTFWSVFMPIILFLLIGAKLQDLANLKKYDYSLFN